MAVGAKIVFFAGAFDGNAFVDLFLDERVTIAAGVPTVWIGLAEVLARRGRPAEALRHIVSGGASRPGR